MTSVKFLERVWIGILCYHYLVCIGFRTVVRRCLCGSKEY